MRMRYLPIIAAALAACGPSPYYLQPEERPQVQTAIDQAVAKTVREWRGRVEALEAQGDKAARTADKSKALSLYSQAIKEAETQPDGEDVNRDVAEAVKGVAMGRKKQPDERALYSLTLDQQARAANDLRESASLGDIPKKLREKIIAFASGLKNPSELPEEARKHAVQAQYLLKQGRGPSEVAEQYRAALLVAPWWAEGYYNLALAEEKQGDAEAAIRHLNYYLASDPPEEEQRKLKDKLYELELLAKEGAERAAMAGQWTREDNPKIHYDVNIAGNQLVAKTEGDNHASANIEYPCTFRGELKGEDFEGNLECEGRDLICNMPGQITAATGKLSPDHQSITFDYTWQVYQYRYHSNCALCPYICDGTSMLGKEHTTKTLVKADDGDGYQTSRVNKNWGGKSR